MAQRVHHENEFLIMIISYVSISTFSNILSFSQCDCLIYFLAAYPVVTSFSLIMEQHRKILLEFRTSLKLSGDLPPLSCLYWEKGRLDNSAV